ncbi:MAG: aldo/keto reductase [Rectinemataceae bacterium]|nr:aldo/keto reductase [Rectinemataceae bacterium]
MHYRRLGKTGIEVSTLGFGCMRLPTLGAPDRIDESAATRLLHEAIDAGVNYIDTAWFYHSAVAMAGAGESEPFVGRALSGGPGEGWRNRVYLATKLPQQLIKTREEMDGFLARQLERLQTDHIDFYLVHGLNGDSWNRMRDLGVREFLDKARERGLIRHAAFSFHGKKEDFPRIIDEYDAWAFGQIQYNYIDTDYQAGISGLRYAAEKGLGVVVMEPLKGGRLANKVPPEMQAVFDARPEGWSPAEWALRYVWNEPGVSLLLSGMGEKTQLEENLRVAGEATAGAMTAEMLEVYAAARIALQSRTKVECTACRYCQPCPFGVQIPECLASLNAAALWDTKDAWLTEWSQVKGKPDTCTECGKCEEACPQELPIRKLLKDTSAAFKS